MKRHRLPWLTPKRFRQLAETKAVATRMDDTARELMMGHKPQGRRGDYDRRSMKDLADAQMSALPGGVMGAVLDPTVQAGRSLSDAEIAVVMDCKNGLITDYELAARLRELWRKQAGPVEFAAKNGRYF